jgi:hypothetical protein
LKQEGFILKQHAADPKRYFVGESSINVEITENRDWFDILQKLNLVSLKFPLFNSET